MKISTMDSPIFKSGRFNGPSQTNYANANPEWQRRLM
jgi:hypothetical protein